MLSGGGMGRDGMLGSAICQGYLFLVLYVCVQLLGLLLFSLLPYSMVKAGEV